MRASVAVLFGGTQPKKKKGSFILCGAVPPADGGMRALLVESRSEKSLLAFLVSSPRTALQCAQPRCKWFTTRCVVSPMAPVVVRLAHKQK